MDWDDIQIFLALVRTGSVTSAAKALDINYSTVSRRINAFETKLGVRLFDRSPTGYTTTAAGVDIIEAAERMESEALALQRRVYGRDERLSGLLRVTSTEIIANTLLLPALYDFRTIHPEIEVQLMVSGDNVNLNQHEADIAFRITNKPPDNLVGKQLANMFVGTYVSHEYYQQHIEPDSNSIIEILTGIVHNCTDQTWLNNNFPHAKTHYRFDSITTLLEAAKQGLGIAKLPCLLGDREPALLRLPNSPIEETWSLWILNHIDLRKTARVRIFRDFMIDAISKQQDLIEGRSTTGKSAPYVTKVSNQIAI